MKTIKIKNCGECPYISISRKGGVTCSTTGENFTYQEMKLCPLKKEPIKLELSE